MDLLGLSIPMWLILALFCVVLLYRYATSTFDTFAEMGFPFVKPLPVVGSTLSLSYIKQSPAEQDMKKQEQYSSRTYGYFMGRKPVLFTSDQRIIKQVAITHFNKFQNRSGFGTLGWTDEPILNYNLLQLHGEQWKHVRSAVTPIFSSGKLKQMFPAILNCSDKLIAHLKTTAETPFHVKDYISPFTMDVIASTAFGMDINAQSSTDHPFVSHAGTAFGIPRQPTAWTTLKLSSMAFLISLIPDAVFRLLHKLTGFSFLDHESLTYFSDLTSQLLREEKASEQKQNNFVTMCAEKLVDPATLPLEDTRVSQATGSLWSVKGLTHDEIVAQATTFLLAGYETTSTTIQFFLYSMAHNPEIQERLYREIVEYESEHSHLSYEQINRFEYLESCLHESLRMYPPLCKVDRETNEDTVIDGVLYPKGLAVVFSIYAVHHDPEYWPEPEKFKPERFSSENKMAEQQYMWLPFGVGNRNCVGMRLALLEAKVAIFKLIKQFRFEPTENTVPPEKMKFQPGFGLPVLRSTAPIELRAVSRDSAGE